MTINPSTEFALLEPDLSQVSETERDRYCESLIRSGTANREAVDTARAKVGSKPLYVSESTLSQWELERLKKAPEYGRSEAELNTRVALMLKAQSASPATLSADDYRGLPVFALPEDSPARAGMPNLAADFQMSMEHARSFTQQLTAAADHEATLSEPERAEYADRQERLLLAAFGNDEHKLQAARATIRKATGRDMDLVAIARGTTADLAMVLIFQAENKLARR